MLKELFDAIRNSGIPIFEGFSSSEDVFGNFTVGKNESKDLEIVFAVYDCVFQNHFNIVLTENICIVFKSVVYLYPNKK